MSEEMVVLVDERDHGLGAMDKLEAHARGALHRAVSVILYNSAGDLLIQRRAQGKYHSPGLWANTCCGHPRPNETAVEAAARRLRDEMGLASTLSPLRTLRYQAEVPPDLVENELVHLFTGPCAETPVPNPQEVEAWRFISLDDLQRDVAEDGGAYAEWFKIYLNRVDADLRRLGPSAGASA